MMAMLAGKLEAGRENFAPVAGNSALSRLELRSLALTRDTPAALGHCSVTTHSVLRYWGSMLASFTRLA
jgi:hypothetical protein